MSSQRSAISGLFWRTLLWLAPMLGLWYLARDWVVRLPALWADIVMRSLFSWVEGTQLEGTVQSLLTSIVVPHASGQTALATPDAGERLRDVFGQSTALGGQVRAGQGY